MPIPILYGTSATLPPIILLSAGTRAANVTPPLSAGDVQISTDYGTWTNLATLPSTVSGGTEVQIPISATEATCKTALIRFKDQTVPADWDERYVSVYTYGNASAFDVRLAGTDGKSIISTDAQNLSANLSVNINSINGSNTAAVNVKYQFDGTTGVAGGTFPARQDAGSSLTQQQIRDAMTLSATSAVSVGSVDKYLTTINTSTSAITYTGTYVNAQVKAQDNIDFGAAQKTSLNAATPANIQNSVVVSAGTITSVSNDVGITQIGADKVWSSTSRALTDKINFSISAGTITTNLDKSNYSISGGTISTVSDKSGYSLTNAEHTLIQSDASKGVLLTSANKIATDGSGYVTVNTVNGDVVGKVLGGGSSVLTGVGVSATGGSGGGGTVSGDVTLAVNAQNVGIIASSILSTSANKLLTDGSGYVTSTGGTVSGDVTLAVNSQNVGIIASSILTTSANKIATDGSGYVTTNNVTGNVSGSVGSVVSAVDINNNSANKNIIASSMKSQDVTGTSAVTGSIYDDLLSYIISGGVGSNLVTFKTTDENGAVVGSVWIGIYNSSSNLIRSTISDDNGLVSGSNSMVLDDGTYSGRFSKSLYSYPVQSLVVSGDTSFTVSGTQYVITSGAVGTQVLYGYVIHGDSTVASGCTVKAELESIGDFANSYLITTKTISTTTTSAGFYQLNLVKGADFRISEVWNGKSYYVKTITISNDATKDISTY